MHRWKNKFQEDKNHKMLDQILRQSHIDIIVLGGACKILVITMVIYGDNSHTLESRY
jgi:hypothetical protein